MMSSNYAYIVGIEVNTKFGLAVIIGVLELSEGVFMFLARAEMWEDWIYEADLAEAAQS